MLNILFRSHRAGPKPLFPTGDAVERPLRGRQLEQDLPSRLADAADCDRENGPSLGRNPGDIDSASGSEKVIAVRHTDSSIVDRDCTAGSRRSTGARVHEGPLLRRRRVRYVRVLTRSIATGKGKGWTHEFLPKTQRQLCER